MSGKYTGKGAHAPGRCEHGDRPAMTHQKGAKHNPAVAPKPVRPDTAAKGKSGV
jgi:hypothetical protein